MPLMRARDQSIWKLSDVETRWATGMALPGLAPESWSTLCESREIPHRRSDR